jgi:uncharacterized protein (TIGR02271 family)
MNISDPQSVVGKDVLGADGEKIGKVEDLYLDRDTDQPEWVSVTTGFFGSHRSLVPLAEASDEGGNLRVPYSKDQVKEAPHYDPGQELSEEEEADLFRHYGRGYAGQSSEAPTAPSTAPTSPRTDDAMTRSEERLQVGTEKVETGRARLRKYVVTENVQTTVPVSREEVRIEREPITEANREAAMSGSEFTEQEHEVTLTAEQPVVGKETVPVERVRLGKEKVTGEQEVSEEVRKEQIETDDQSGTEQPRR